MIYLLQNLIKKTRFVGIVILVSTIITIFPIAVFAQNDGATSFGGFRFTWFDIGSQLDLKNFGVLSVAGYLAAFVVSWMAIYTMWLVFKIAWTYLQSRGDSGAVEKATETSRELIKGLLVIFMWMAIYAGFSIFMGVGNMFRWGEALTQCGDGTPYFQAEYNARQQLREKGLAFADEPPYRVVSYCCTDISRFNDNYDAANLRKIVNVGENGSGWYFENINSASSTEYEGCRIIFD